MCLKAFGYKGNNFKYPVNSLLKQLMITTFGILEDLMVPIIEKYFTIEKEKDDGEKDIDNKSQNEVENENGEKEEIVDTRKKQDINTLAPKSEKSFRSEIDSEFNKSHKIQKNERTQGPHPEQLKFVASNQRNAYLNHNLIPSQEFEDKEIYQIATKLFKLLVSIADGKRKDLIQINIYSKSLAIELISGIIEQSGFVMRFFPEIIEVIKNELSKIIKKNFETTNDYIMGNYYIFINM